jgi:cytochrome c1
MRWAALLIALALPAGAQESDAAIPRRDALPGAEADAGRALIAAYGCGICHTIPGIAGARGTVGPDLTSMGRRDFIAGSMPNTPGWMVRWLVAPGALKPDSAMPDMGVTPEEAERMAAYLATLRGQEPSRLARLWTLLLRGPAR